MGVLEEILSTQLQMKLAFELVKFCKMLNILEKQVLTASAAVSEISRFLLLCVLLPQFPVSKMEVTWLPSLTRILGK